MNLYILEKNPIFCNICSTVFRYEEEIMNEKLSKNFTNLKKSLLRHLDLASHKENLKEAANKEKYEASRTKREKEIGWRIGRIAYFLYKQGRPDTDFESIIFLHNSNGSDIGDINHSKNFPPKFIPFVGNEISEHLTMFLNTSLFQTGFKTCGKIGADKAAWKHRSR